MDEVLIVGAGPAGTVPMGGYRLHELVRPAERSVNADLVRAVDRVQERRVVEARAQIGDDGYGGSPVDRAGARVGRLRREIDAGAHKALIDELAAQL